MTKPLNFRTAFCKQTHCAESAFEGALFRRSLYWHAVPLAFLIRFLEPKFFHDDDEFIRYLGGDVSLEEVAEDIDRFEYGNRVRGHWLRTALRLHLDPDRVAALARRCLAG